MAIAVTADLRFQPFPVPPTEGRPTGLFAATIQTNHDAGGGNVTQTIRLTSGVPHGLILQFDQVVIHRDSTTGDFFVINVQADALQDQDMIIRGEFFQDQHVSLRELQGYIHYPSKGFPNVVTLVTDNDDGVISGIAMRGKYWDRSYLRQRGETPAFG